MKDKKNSTIDGLEKKNIFSIPENYFEKMPLEISRKIEASSLTKIAFTKNIFQVPDGYFEKLPEAIADEVLVSEKLKSPIFIIPEGYFEQLPKAIAQKVIPRDLLLADQLKSKIFLAPEGYFNKLPLVLQEKIARKNQPIWLPDLSLKPTLRYAIAACTLATLLLSGWWLLQNRTYQNNTFANQNQSSQSVDIEAVMAQLNKEDIHDYLAHHEHEDILIEAAMKSKKKIHKEIEKTIPVHKHEKEIIREELELLDTRDLETDMEL
ncbi:MAG TPA: hypothetical protein VK766_05205 [Cytophagaceae bacterium]|jgi:hypothetical protein|nr:hypothetical protein [Cytophagaceae bacterium]